MGPPDPDLVVTIDRGRHRRRTGRPSVGVPPGFDYLLGRLQAGNPETLVLSRETGFPRPHGNNPYSGYDRADQPAFLFDGRPDERLLPKERIAAFNIGEVSAAFPFLVLEEERVVNYTVNNTDVVVFFKPGTVSALARRLIIDSRDIGSSGVFEA